jgi:regulatory helix-turn-helix LysR family protein
MRVKTHQIGYFIALCEEKSFTRAAKRCGVAQPSLTRAIKELESELGGELFERNRTNVSLTGLGHHLKPDFVRIDRALSEVARKAAEFKTKPEVTAHSETKETSMRVVAITVLAIAIIATGLALRPTSSATAPVADQTSNPIDPYATESTIWTKSLLLQAQENRF